MKKKYFGTDGIRGKVGEYPITPDFMLKLGWAAGKVFAKEGIGKILVGKDTRISGYMFESALEAGLVAAGIDVLLLGPMPTPAVAYLTNTFRAEAGIVISASHNPHYDNGIKFFSTQGIKLDDELEQKIEAQFEQEMTTVASEELGKFRRLNDAAGRYIEFCKASAKGLNLHSMKIVLDCANGATYHITPKVLTELGAEIIEIASSPDGLNINNNCGATHTDQLQAAVLEEKADLGIALDGDGDRVILVDHTGAVVDGDEILYIIASHLQQRGELKGGVVGTQMSNFGLEQAFKRQNIPFVRAKVGDRHVMIKLAEKQWQLGGESSGHIVCRHLTSTGDGTVAALQVLLALLDNEKSLYDLKQGMTKMPQTMINVPLKQKTNLDNLAALQSSIVEVEEILGDTGRILLRPSGTEPLVRVMVEGEDAKQVESLCKQLVSVLENELKSLDK